MVSPFMYLLCNNFTRHAHVYMKKANKITWLPVYMAKKSVLLEKFSWGSQVPLTSYHDYGKIGFLFT